MITTVLRESRYLPLFVLGVLTACSVTPDRGGRGGHPTYTGSSGGYYQDDGPGENPPAGLDSVPDAQPKWEPLRRRSNEPYTVLGRTYVPDRELKPYKAQGVATWYGRKFHGQKTSSGEIYDMYAMTAAHTTLPIPSYARVTNLRNDKSIIVRINDRGPFHSDRLIDLSYAAAHKLGIIQRGSATVEVESINPLEDKPAMQVAGTLPANLPDFATPESLETSLPGAPGIYVQLGAFSARENAEIFAARIRQQLGALAEAVQILVRDAVYRVNLGPYSDRASADRIATQVMEDLKITPFVVAP